MNVLHSYNRIWNCFNRSKSTKFEFTEGMHSPRDASQNSADEAWLNFSGSVTSKMLLLSDNRLTSMDKPLSTDVIPEAFFNDDAALLISHWLSFSRESTWLVESTSESLCRSTLLISSAGHPFDNFSSVFSGFPTGWESESLFIVWLLSASNFFGPGANICISSSFS